MNINSDWEFFGATPGGQPFQMGGLDVWQYEWSNTYERACVKDPLYHQDFTFNVWEITGPDGIVSFAAGEFSNCMWGFYIKKRNI